MPVLLLLMSIFAAASCAADRQASIDKADSAIAEFQDVLRQELMAAMQKGGPIAAIDICHEKAPAIAGKLSQQHNVELRRTALRYRNPSNAPDPWERETLEKFVADQKSGKPFAELSAIREEGQSLRYMKAIGTQSMCTVCHGKQVSGDLSKAIAAKYPQDKATGFAEGDLRGAFSVRLATPPSN